MGSFRVTRSSQTRCVRKKHPWDQGIPSLHSRDNASKSEVFILSITIVYSTWAATATTSSVAADAIADPDVAADLAGGAVVVLDGAVVGVVAVEGFFEGVATVSVERLPEPDDVAVGSSTSWPGTALPLAITRLSTTLGFLPVFDFFPAHTGCATEQLRGLPAGVLGSEVESFGGQLRIWFRAGA
jgi:hypothetical protein